MPNAGFFPWLIPTYLDSGQYILAIYSMEGGSFVLGLSENFTILNEPYIPPPPSFISITNPLMGAILDTGNTYDITWESSGPIDYVDIELWSMSGPAEYIASGTDNDGFYQWTVPSDMDSGYYALNIYYDGDDFMVSAMVFIAINLQ